MKEDNVHLNLHRLLVALTAVLAVVGCDDGARPGGGAGDGAVDMLPGDLDTGGDQDMGPGPGDVSVGADQAPTPDVGDNDATVGGDAGDGAVEADMTAGDASVVEPNACAPCESDDDCAPEGARCLEFDDGDFCGAPCTDDEDCEEDSTCAGFDDGDPQCIPVRGSCMDCDDADHDGYGVGPGCLGLDCNDADPLVHPGTDDGCDGVDNDCDDSTDEDFLAESCGIGACAAQSACVAGVAMACAAGQPAADDFTCDGVDDDCDGSVDEAYVPDTCGEGPCAAESACVAGVERACAPLPGTADDATCDGLDQDCDGFVDEDFVGAPCGQGACAMTGVCLGGQVECAPGEPLGADDAICNGVDEDCDGQVDEDFTIARTCGLGACRRDFACVDADLACAPGDPLSADDATCDGVDDDCDGFVDEDCQQNFLTYALNDEGADFIDVDVVFDQTHSPANDGSTWLPRIIELRLLAPDALVLRTPSNVGVVPGPAAMEAMKNVSLVSRNETGIRILILSSSNTNRIHPGVLCTLRFTHELGLTGPFSFGFNVERTGLAPEEAQDVLNLVPVELGSP